MPPASNGGNGEYDHAILRPHPLVCGLAVGVNSDGTLAQANQAAAYSLALDPPRGGPPPGDDLTEPPNLSYALESFPGPHRPQVVMFAGYLGPTQINQVDRRNGIWRLLYQDAKAMTWLLVPEKDIVLHHRARDRKAAFGLRDIIWVRADAPVRQGDEAESEQARFLVGRFTSAGDLHASLTNGGTFAAESGILCAPTPDCCGPHTHR